MHTPQCRAVKAPRGASKYRITVKDWDRHYGEGHVVFKHFFEVKKSAEADAKAVEILEKAMRDYGPPKGREAAAWAERFDPRYGPQTLRSYTASNGAWIDTRRGIVNEAQHVADFNTLDNLIAHAARDLGATHASGSEANTKLYFPRGGQYPYEEATVWRKNGYWHAQGPSARTGIAKLPSDARSIGGRGERRAAEAPRREDWDNTDTLHRSIHFPRLNPGVRVSAGKIGTEDYDTGVIVSILGNRAVVEWDSGTQTEAWLMDLRPTTERRSSSHVRDYIAVDRRGKTIAGPFKTYGPAKDAAGTAGNVEYVRPGVSEARTGDLNFQQGERLRIRVIGPKGQLADPPFWYTVPHVIDLEELALQFSQTIQPGMFVSISDGKNSWTFQKETHAGRNAVRRTHKLPTARYRENVGEAKRRRAGVSDPLELAKRAGEAYASDQINGDYFMNWVREQLFESSKMDPSQVLPLETKDDAMVIARNMFQDLEWDTKRQLDNVEIARLSGASSLSREVATAFYDGFKETLNSSRDWLADELLEIKQEVRGGRVAEAPAGVADRRRGYHGNRGAQGPITIGTRVLVTAGDSMHRGRIGTVVRPDALRTARLDNFNRGQLKRGAVLIETDRGELFVELADALKPTVDQSRGGMAESKRRRPKAKRSTRRKRR